MIFKNVLILLFGGAAAVSLEVEGGPSGSSCCCCAPSPAPCGCSPTCGAPAYPHPGYPATYPVAGGSTTTCVT